MLPKHTPTVETPCLTALSGLSNRQVAVVSNDHYTIRPVTMSPKYGNSTLKDNKLQDQGSSHHDCVSNVPVFAHPKLSNELYQHLSSQASYPTLQQKSMEIKDGQWKTTESNAMKLSLSCPTLNTLSGSIKVEKTTEKLLFKESVMESNTEFVGKHLYTMQKSSSRALTAFNGDIGQQDTNVKYIFVKPVQEL